MMLVDSNVLLDIYKADPVWMPWLVRQLRSAKSGQLAVNMVVYAELAGLAFRKSNKTWAPKPECCKISLSERMRWLNISNYSPVIQGATKPTFLQSK